MSEFRARVKLGDDGVYRWFYDMDLTQNKSILYTLEKVNLFTFLGVSIGGALFIMAVEGNASFARGVLWIGLALGVLMALLYWIGFHVFAGIRRGEYRVHFAMREDGIELVWSDRLKEGFALGEKALAVTGAAMGSRMVRGRWRPTLDEVSNVRFSTVIRYRSYPKWNMIDLSVPGGKFQVYAGDDDLAFVGAYILERLPERVRRAN